MEGRGKVLTGFCALVSIAITSGCSAMRLADVGARELDKALRAEKPKGIRSLDLAMLGRPEINEDRLEPGDLVEVTVSDLLQENQNHSVITRIGADGSLSLPLVGLVNVRELTIPQSEQAIFTSYSGKGYLRNPRIVVNVKERRPNRVYVIGGVKAPAVYQLPRGESDLLAAIIAAGGLSDDAGTTVEVRRRPPANGPEISVPKLMPTVVRAASSNGRGNPKADDKGSPRVSTTNGLQQTAASQQSQADAAPATSQTSGQRILRYDLAKPEGMQTVAQGVALQNGDIVVIERHKQAPIYVLGSVHSPGVYQLPLDRELRVLEAIGGAGGVNANTTPDKALVLRHHPDGQAVTAVKVDLQKAKKDLEENLLLMPGDTVSVEETPASFMRGLVRNAFRVGVGVGAQYNALGPPGAGAF